MKKAGDKGEIFASKYLLEQGYFILETNFKYSIIGEIDIIAKKDDKIIFIEVKARKNQKYGMGEESITKGKMKKIYQTILYYCSEKNIPEEDIQFDVIVINWQEKKLKHYKNQSLFL